tara:strand:+ start:1608 stop:1727 length:120 start_codon:yes stop_codon:yes gene_type:complete
MYGKWEIICRSAFKETIAFCEDLELGNGSKEYGPWESDV